MERARCAERALKLRRLAEQNSTPLLFREGYRQLADELERLAAQMSVEATPKSRERDGVS
jgi:hypothetical protein